jgi:N-acetylneuraminate synthase
MKPEDANLNCIKTLQKIFNCPVGYSGHESGLAISYAAAGMGITVLERHITLDRAMYGSDHAASLEVAGLRNLCGTIRKMQISYGDGIKRITPEERAIAEKLRSHIKVK